LDEPGHNRMYSDGATGLTAKEKWFHYLMGQKTLL